MISWLWLIMVAAFALAIGVIVIRLAAAEIANEEGIRIAELEAVNAKMRDALASIAREMTGVSPEVGNLQMACDTAASVARAALGDSHE